MGADATAPGAPEAAGGDRTVAASAILVATGRTPNTARIGLDVAGVDSILVGDSLGMVVQGQPDSLAVTVDEMVYHTRLVMRGATRALVVSDAWRDRPTDSRWARAASVEPRR